MLFTSYRFIGFMAAVFLLYYLLPKKCQWPFLLAASYTFYYIANPYYLIFIGVTTVSTYAVSLRIDAWKERQDAYLKSHKDTLNREEKKAYKASVKAKQWRWLLLCLVFNLGILAVLKYTNFMIANLNGLLEAFGRGGRISFADLILPMGISFYT